jgi:serine protease Do
MRKFIAYGPALVVLVTALVTLVAAPAAVRLVGYAATDAQVQLARHSLEQDNILKQIDRATRAIADAVEPSVVHIGVDEPTRGGRLVRSGQGSGWVFDGSGHIVTNSHVVRDARRIFVQFQDGRAVEADMVGHDRTTDIAVLKVRSVEGLVPMLRATGRELHQGDRVFAFGSPFGFKFSMSEGIVSGLGRDPRLVIGEDGYTNFIQTDAAVNPGNSGGPLVDVEGKLVGMNVAIATAAGSTPNDGQSAGISFAIPLTTIESVVMQLINTGVVTRGYLGITHSGRDEANIAELNRLGFRGLGVLATGVQPGGPADTAGIRAGDIIMRLNGEAVTGVAVLRSAITNNAPGDKVTVEVVRDGKAETFTVTLGYLPRSPTEMREAAEVASRFGIVDVEQTADGGLVVTQVRVPSPAATAGLRPLQTIVGVGGRPVATLTEFFEALASNGLHQGREVKMTVRTAEGQEREVTVRPR